MYYTAIQKNYNNLINQEVLIRSTHIKSNRHTVGLCGVITKVSGSSFGIKIEGQYNPRSEYGCYWFHRNEFKLVKDVTDISDTYDYVADVKIYGDPDAVSCALFSEDYNSIMKILASNCGVFPPVVIKQSESDSMVIGEVERIYNVDDLSVWSGNKRRIRYQIVGTADLSNFNIRVDKLHKAAEIHNKELIIRNNLSDYIRENGCVDIYRNLAQHLDNNSDLLNMISELEQLQQETDK